MKILIVTGIYPPDIGGPASYVPAVAAGLTGLDHEVAVLTLADGLAPNFLTRGSDAAHGFRVLRLERELPRLIRLFLSVWLIWTEARRADVVLAAGLGFEAALAAKLARRPLVCKIVGDMAWERSVLRGWYKGGIDEYQTAAKAFMPRLLDFLRSYPARAAKLVVTPCAYLSRMVTRWSPKARIVIIPNACYALDGAASGAAGTEGAPDAPIFKSDWPGLTLLTVCRLTPWKRVDELIGLVARARGLRLIVVGDGPMRQPWESMAERLHLHGRVVFTGARDAAGVAQAMRQADALILNSTYEGHPHVVLEAARAGLPVVAAASGGISEMIVPDVTGLVYPCGNIRALVQCLDRLAREPDLGRELAQAARARLDADFTFSGLVSRTEAVLKAACGQEEAA